MSKKLKLGQALLATVAFLDKLFFNTDIDALGNFLGEFLLTTVNKDGNVWPELWDPAVWIDWQESAGVVLKLDKLDVKSILVTNVQAYLIMQNHMQGYIKIIDSHKFTELVNTLNIDNYEIFKKDWLLCVEAALNQKLTVGGCLIDSQTIISRQQFLEIVQIFLKNYVSNDVSVQLINLLNASNLQHFYTESMQYIESAQSLISMQDIKSIKQTEKLKTAALTLNQAFIFMHQIVDQQRLISSQQTCELEFLWKKLQMTEKNTLVEYKVFYHWRRAAYAVLFK